MSAQQLPPDMAEGWRAYLAENDRQIAEADASSNAFLFQDIFPARQAREAIGRGEIFTMEFVLVRDGRFPVRVPGAMVHHWAGTVHVPGVTLDDVLAFVQDYDSYPSNFEDVDAARILAHDRDSFQVALRVFRTHVITAHFNTEHEVRFERHGPRRASQRRSATKIAELDNVGEATEREKVREPTLRGMGC